MHTQHIYSKSPRPWPLVLFPWAWLSGGGSTLRLKTTPIKPKEEEEDGDGSGVPRPEGVPTWDSVALTTTATQGFSTFAPPSSPSPTPFAVSFLYPSFQRHNGVSLSCAEGCKHKLTLPSCLLPPLRVSFSQLEFWRLQEGKPVEGVKSGSSMCQGRFLVTHTHADLGRVGGPAKERTLASEGTAWFCPKFLVCKYIPTEFRTPSLPHCLGPFRLQ